MEYHASVKTNEEAFFVVIWKYIQDILLMGKSKEQKNIVCYHLGKRVTLYIQVQTPKRKYVNIKKYISILYIEMYIHTKRK